LPFTLNYIVFLSAGGEGLLLSTRVLSRSGEGAELSLLSEDEESCSSNSSVALSVRSEIHHTVAQMIILVVCSDAQTEFFCFEIRKFAVVQR